MKQDLRHKQDASENHRMGRKVVGTRSRSSLQSHSYVEVLEESFAHSKEPLKFLIEDKDLS